MDRQVVVQGGGDNLYKISEYNNTYYVYHVSVGFITNSYDDIGQTKSLEDALALIKVHSGREIKKISQW